MTGALDNELLQITIKVALIQIISNKHPNANDAMCR